MAPTPLKTPKKGSTAANRVVSASPSSPTSPSPRVRKLQKEAPEFGTQMTNIFVGAGRKMFPVHKSLLMSMSGFFAAGLSSSFKEAESGIFEMEEEDAATFSVFVQWIYTNRLYIKKTASPGSSVAEDDQEEWERLPRLYTLGERLDAPRFQDVVMSAIIEKVGESKIIPDNWALYTYQNTVTGCALRRLIVDFHVFAHQGKLLKKGAEPDAEDADPVFLQDVMSRMIDAGVTVFNSAGHMPWANACLYHEHGDDACHLAEEDDIAPSPRLRFLRRSARSSNTASSLNGNTNNNNINNNDDIASIGIFPPGALAKG
ncbi:hypothetical protein E4T39_07719 [Aureobasidium subglaciale]|nr:hypothetical protein E4T39_07719 [Aureobasidium subglaciale]